MSLYLVVISVVEVVTHLQQFTVLAAQSSSVNDVMEDMK